MVSLIQQSYMSISNAKVNETEKKESAEKLPLKPDLPKETVFQAVNQLGMNLFRNRGMTEAEMKMAKEPISVAIAPICLMDLLGMVSFTVPEKDKDQYFNNLKLKGMKSTDSIVAALKTIPFEMKDGATIRINRILANEEGSAHEELQNYGVEIIKGKDLVNKVNARVSELTNNKIKNLLKERVIEVLASIFYLKLNWMKQFDPNYTKPQQFNLINMKAIEVQMMNRKFKADSVNTYDHKEYSVLDLPFVAPDGRELSKLILLPNKGVDLFNLEKTFDPIAVLSNLKPLETALDVYLPKTRTNWGKEDLKPLLKEMGIEGIKYDQVIMKVISETNEKGAEVAAVAAATFRSTSMTPIFYVNRSYASYIVDKKNKLILVAEDFVDEAPFKDQEGESTSSSTSSKRMKVK